MSPARRRPLRPNTAVVYKPLGLVLQSNALAAATPSDVSNIGVVVYNGQELGRLAGLRAQSGSLIALAYLNMGLTKDYEYQDSYTGNTMVQPWSWLQYPTTGVPYGQAVETPREDWFVHRVGTSATAANRIQSAGFPGLWMMNVGNADYQDTWAANAISFCRSWGFDGAMADDCNPYINFHTGGDTTTLEWTTEAAASNACLSFLVNVGAKMKAAGLHLVPNLSDAWRVGRPTLATTWAPNVSGFLYEHWPFSYAATSLVLAASWNAQLDNVRDVQAGGGYAVPIGYHPASTPDLKAMRVGRAMLELVRAPGTRTAYAYNGVTSAGVFENVNPTNLAWTRNLGEPTGTDTTSGTARVRTLTKGFVAVNPVGGSTQTITCPIAGTRTSNGAAISAGATFSLAADDAEIVWQP